VAAAVEAKEEGILMVELRREKPLMSSRRGEALFSSSEKNSKVLILKARENFLNTLEKKEKNDVMIIFNFFVKKILCNPT